MSFFLNADITLGEKLLEIIYIVIGLITLYTGIKNIRDKENPSRLGTGIFWCALGVVLSFGRFISPVINGVLIIIMTIPAIFRKVKIGKQNTPDEAATNSYMKKME